MSRLRSRAWLLAAVALLLGSGSVLTASAAGTDGAVSSLVPIVPCRIADTRPDTLVGPRSTPIGPGESVTFQITGTNGNCTIPTTATGIASNVTIVNPNSSSFLTIYPADANKPNASNLNWTPTSSPTPNQVTVALSGAGAINAFNNSGTIDVIIDIVGYYTPAASGPGGLQGPKGPTGDKGPKGPVGVQGDPGASATQQGPQGTSADNMLRVIDVAVSGGDFTTVTAAMAAIGSTLPTAGMNSPYLIRIAPGTYNEPATINLKDYVSMRGSGRTVTTLAVTGAGSTTVSGAGDLHFQISDLTIGNTSPGNGGNGLSLTNATTPGAARISDVDIVLAATSGTANGINLTNSDPIITGVGIAANVGGAVIGIRAQGFSAPRIDRTAIDVTGTGATGLLASQSDLTASALTVVATSRSESAAGVTGLFSGTLSIANSHIAASAPTPFPGAQAGIQPLSVTLLLDNVTVSTTLPSNAVMMGVDGSASTLTIRDSDLSKSAGVRANNNTVGTVTNSVTPAVTFIQGIETLVCAFNVTPAGAALDNPGVPGTCK